MKPSRLSRPSRGGRGDPKTGRPRRRTRFSSASKTVRLRIRCHHAIESRKGPGVVVQTRQMIPSDAYRVSTRSCPGASVWFAPVGCAPSNLDYAYSQTGVFRRGIHRRPQRQAGGDPRGVQSEDGRSAQAARMLRYAQVQAALQAAIQARSRRTQITADRVVTELAKLAFSNVLDFVNVRSDGSVFVDLSRVTRD